MNNKEINKEFSPNHIILSRKGFDSAAGGNASMIIDVNGKKYIQPLPIPDSYDIEGGITYGDIDSYIKGYKLDWLLNAAGIEPKLKVKDEENSKKEGKNKYKYIEKIKLCHKDPDLFKGTEKAAFGQMGSSEAHLRRNKVGKNDLFLFFGWYKSYKLEGDELIRQRDVECDDRHVLYGYLYVDEEYDLTKKERFDAVPDAYHNHPHYRKQKNDRIIKNNRLYVAKEFIPGTDIPGFGVFEYDEDLILSKDNAPKSMWRRDEGSFMSIIDEDREMTYHTDKCWQNNYFQSVARGQEFVIKSSGDENEQFRQDIYNFILGHRKK